MTATASLPKTVVDVRDYNARGDGTHDDRAAIQSAINAAVARELPLYLPPGTWQAALDATHPALTVAGDLQIIGAGEGLTTLLLPTAQPTTVGWTGLDIDATAGAVNVTIRDLTFQGPSVGQDYSVHPNTTVTRGIYLRQTAFAGTASVLKLERVSALGRWFAFLSAGDGSPTVELRDCGRLEADIEVCGLFNGVDTGALFIARNCWFAHAGLATADPRNETGLPNGVLCYIHPHWNALVEGCRFSDCVRYGLYFNGTPTAVPDYQLVRGCVFEADCAKGIQLCRKGKYLIEANVFLSAAGPGIESFELSVEATVSVRANRFRGTQVVIDHAGTAAVSNNTFELDGLAGGVSALQLASGKHRAARNVFEGTGTACYGIGVTSGEADVDDNHFFGSGGAGYSCINLLAGILHAHGNVCDGTWTRMILSAPNNAGDVTAIRLDDNEVRAGGGDFLLAGDGIADGAITGEGNLIGSSGIDNRNTTFKGYLIPRRGLQPTPVASATTTTLDWDHDRFYVSGTATIANLYVGDSDQIRLYGGTVTFQATGAWTLTDSGNIRPRSLTARSVGDVVRLAYDPATAVWTEG